MFNPEEFMNTQFEAAEFETRRSLIPPGDYTVVIDNLEFATVGDRNLPIIRARYKIVNASEPELNDRMLFDTIWLDMDEQGKSLLRGPDKNLRLGQLLEACHLNGKPWSPGMLQGQVILVQVGVGVNKRSNEEENTVKRIAEAA